MNINSAPNLSAKFNNNIRCIEINIKLLLDYSTPKFNNNIRCIEISTMYRYHSTNQQFNNNIRCIEILSANELEIFFNRLITT